MLTQTPQVGTVQRSLAVVTQAIVLQDRVQEIS
jgi:hypothetical protein